VNLDFRTRVITAAVTAAFLAVFILSAASFLTTRNALLSSTDQSLLQGTSENDQESSIRTFFVFANGQATAPDLPADPYVMRLAQLNNHRRYFRTISFQGNWYRELLIPETLTANFSCSNTTCTNSAKGVQIYWVNFNGQVNELRLLLRTLLFFAAVVLTLALTIGLWLTQHALRPLERVTNEIEEISQDGDVTRRLRTGGRDEIGRLRTVFNRLLKSVDESQATQRQLVLDASHELRTPLTSLRTNAQVLARASELTREDLDQLTADMVAQVDELSSLVSDLAELSREGRTSEDLVPFRFDEVAEECVETARTYARIKNIRIEFTAEPSIVTGRRERLTRALSNLLTNAIKFTPEGGEVSVVVTPGTFLIGDSGPGIAEADRAHVFDRFWRAASSRALPGSGLGLSIVAQVVSEFGGAITVGRDENLGGAQFTVVLPSTAAANPEGSNFD
jgi:signal transduction histidine kinase